MALRYPQQTYAVYPPPQWPGEIKHYPDDDDSTLDHQSPTDLSDSRRHSTVKIEDEYHGAPTMYHDRHDRPPMAQMRHYSHPNVPLINTHHIARPQDHPYSASYGPAPQWPMPSHSGSNTPTPMFGAVQEPIQVQFASTGNYSYQPQDPASAVSMSPQSSHGGWASATSSDDTEQRGGRRSPHYRPMSPMTVMRSDGIRKKNARFEIPKERNLANIDTLISMSTDDVEKKELKQQKRLLRNRQAALDSRQRKKTHTEKLELEKKHFVEEKKSLEDSFTHLESTLAHEREAFRQQQQQYEHFIQQLQFERDEAIRTKTLETGELRRQNNILKECVRDLERQQAKNFHNGNATDNFTNDFSNFGNLDIGNDWDDEFSLINSDDLKMEGEDTPQRSLTPRPPPASEAQLVTTKDASFSWNTFYMCLLVGAFIASNLTKDSAMPSSASSLSTQLPTLSEDYRNDARNVLKAVLAADGDSIQGLIPSSSSSVSAGSSLPTTISGSELSRMSGQAPSSLDSLHASLTTPSRQQQVAAAFSLTSDQYSHITNPEGIFDDDDDDDDDHSAPKPPSQLEQMFASMQARQDEQDRMTGLGSKARERSVLLDRVPEKVLKDFREMVEMSQKQKEKEQRTH